MVSLLKAWWGDAATPENDFCFDYLPRLTGIAQHLRHGVRTARRRVQGLLPDGREPGGRLGQRQDAAPGHGEPGLARGAGLLPHRERHVVEGRARDRVSGELRTEDIGTEVFFFPAAAHTEKSGSFTNTNRMLQWHDKAVEPAGDARSDLWFMYHLGRIIREKLAGSTDRMDRPILDLTWDYPTEGQPDEPEAEAVLAEINGFDGDGNPLSDLHPAAGRRLAPRAAAGSTAGCTPTASTRPRAASRTPSRTGSRPSGPGRGRPTGASSTTGPRRRPTARRGASERSSCGGTRTQGSWTGHDVPDFEADKAPTTGRPGRHRLAGALGHRPVHHAGRRQGLAVRARRGGRRPAADPLRAAGLARRQPAVRPAAQPGAAGLPPRAQPLPADRRRRRAPTCTPTW